MQILLTECSSVQVQYLETSYSRCSLLAYSDMVTELGASSLEGRAAIGNLKAFVGCFGDTCFFPRAVDRPISSSIAKRRLRNVRVTEPSLR